MNEANKVLFHQEKCMIFLFKVFLNCFYVPLAFDRGSVRMYIDYLSPSWRIKAWQWLLKPRIEPSSVQLKRPMLAVDCDRRMMMNQTISIVNFIKIGSVVLLWKHDRRRDRQRYFEFTILVWITLTVENKIQCRHLFKQARHYLKAYILLI